MTAIYQPDLPRLTRSLRAFTNLENPAIKRLPKPSLEEQLEKIRAFKKQANQADNLWQWEEIKKKVTAAGGGQAIDDLWRLSKEISPQEPNQVIYETCLLLLRRLLPETKPLHAHVDQFKKIFTSLNFKKFTEIFQVIRTIDGFLDEADRSAIFNQPCDVKRRFGDHEFVAPSSVPWDSGLELIGKLRDFTDTNARTQVLDNFNLEYDPKTMGGELQVSTSRKKQLTDQQQHVGLKWLRAELEAANVSNLEDVIIEWLKLDQSSEALQEKLFDLLGFDRFSLIEALLEKRGDIVEAATRPLKLVPLLDNRRPTVASQVVVQMDYEKKIEKLIRKEERRANRSRQPNDSSDEEDERRARLRQPTIQFNKLVKRRHNNNDAATHQYPHVFDQQKEVKQMAGFIAGKKLMLPLNAEKIDDRMYEQVTIPLSDAVPPGVGDTRVQISTALNEIGRMAFEGIKELNRIQSVVFETAYKTNENLLICAPTGAGKTNVALLAILHQIESHVENGVIEKNSFKIVYVAPMKALAAEMTRSFSQRLAGLGLTVRELTGDMQLTKKEIIETQMLVTTPEKWDVVTRKGSGDIALTQLVKLLIIDEVHLLHGDRGPVVEALVARTLRQVESSQSMIRIVGLSATLPNYLDVARFLRVNPHIGLFYFDARFRPVPLSQTFIGIKATKMLQQMADMDQVCFDKVLEQVQRGHQVMVFVHARNATVRVANALKELAAQKNMLNAFQPTDAKVLSLAMKNASHLRNKQVAELFSYGFSCHHAGMVRSDRLLVEKYFADGSIKVLVCTSTLAWGVNLPAHAVVIRGTEIYDAKHGSFVDLSILDVLQIFGRAGRPQFDTSGHGVIITTHDRLSHYLSLLTNQFPIESNFIKFLPDNLNAEISLGTIGNVSDAVEWLSYTYLLVRVRQNPQVYGINYDEVADDPQLVTFRRQLIHAAAKELDKARMIRYNERTGDLNVTDLGRTASHFYIKYSTVEIFNEMLHPIMTDREVLNLVAHAQEFEQLKVRDDEMDELDRLTHDYCKIPVAGGSENIHGKVNILLQTYLSRGELTSFSLISDQSYIIQNAVRIMRSLFDIALRKNNAIMASRFLTFSKCFEWQMWELETPLRQFPSMKGDIIDKIEKKKLNVERIVEFDVKELGSMLYNTKAGEFVQRCAKEIPRMQIEASIQPITRSVLRIRLSVVAEFQWNDRVHGKSAEHFWIWVEDPENDHIYHHEYFLISKRQVIRQEPQELVITIPISEPLPPQYYVRIVSDRWLGSDRTEPLSFKHLILPELHPPHTDLLPLQPLPVSALNEPKFQQLYSFTHFNPIQTQIFHCLYHTDFNVLLGAPTGSGKTIAAELAMFRVFREYPNSKVVYIAPLKALVRERISDWKVRLEKKMGYNVVELTGDVTPDIRAIAASKVIVTTPEKWDGISRSWQTRHYVQDVALIVIDEIHLLGEDRGPVLEVIVSRTNFISAHTSKKVRVIGLSTALANARDLANWLGIGEMGLYNFRPSVRPVPLEVHISGFPGKHYCPRMATMNKPAFQAIRQYSPAQPVLIFVSSRRQTRLTALDLIAYLAGEDNQKQWLHMSESDIDTIIDSTQDQNLKLTLAFGIGMHHAGLCERDRLTVEELFVNQKIQVLITTATLAWGVNFPAHLVIIKGTEYYDGKLKRYVDMPITDVLQMMGRAGRPQFDEFGIAVVFVHDMKKNFYKKFLYEPFPVESCLLQVLPDHLNAEIVAGTVTTTQQAIEYLTWTYLFRRLVINPSYYNLPSIEPNEINNFLSALVEKTVKTLENSGCVQLMDDDGREIEATWMGRIASYYYLSHKTIRHFADNLSQRMDMQQMLQVLSDAEEYSQIPVRHNEDLLNGELAKRCRFAVNANSLDSAHTKVFLLFQAHFSHLQLPCADYYTDLKSVLDQAIRILQAMIDVTAQQGWLASCLLAQTLVQMVNQAQWHDQSPLLQLGPHIQQRHLRLFSLAGFNSLPEVLHQCRNGNKMLDQILRGHFDAGQLNELYQRINALPIVQVELSLRQDNDNDGDNTETTSTTTLPKKTNRLFWTKVNANSEITIHVRIRRKGEPVKASRKVDDTCFLTLGCIENNDLIALKRVVQPARGQPLHALTFEPLPPGRHILTVYIISAGYLGLDQQYSINLESIE